MVRKTLHAIFSPSICLLRFMGKALNNSKFSLIFCLLKSEEMIHMIAAQLNTL